MYISVRVVGYKDYQKQNKKPIASFLKQLAFFILLMT
jgi:hypothetical protein